MSNDILYTIIYASVEFLSYLMAYLTVFQAELRERKIVCVLGYLLMIGVELSLLFLGGVDEMETYSIITGLFIPMFFFRQAEKKWFLLYPIVVMGVSVIAVSNTFLAAMILDVSELDVLEYRGVDLVCQGVPIVMLIIVYSYQKLKKTEKPDIEITKQQYIIFYTGLICAFIILGGTQALSSDWDMTIKMKNAYGLAIAVICEIFVIMSLWQGIIVSREMKYKHQTELYEEYMAMQEERIHTIIADDEKMRRYRHDMKAHLAVIKSYCESNENEKLEKYYDDIIEHSAIFATKQYTGNTAVDAVIRQLLEEAEEKEIEVKFHSMLKEKLIVSEFDLCTIISNLVKNAIEACEKIEDKKIREIKINIVSQDDHIYILVTNRVAQDTKIKNQELFTTKADTKNHGLGSKNIKSAVDKYKGKLEYRCENGWFEAEILM